MSSAEPAQNVIYIADHVKVQSKRLRKPANITSHTEPAAGNDLLNDTLKGAVDGILKVHFESDKTRNSCHTTPLIHSFRKLRAVISTNDDQNE